MEAIRSVPTRSGTHRRGWFWALLLLITSLGAGVRLYQLETGSFWADELYTIRSLNSLEEGRWQWTKVLGYLPTYAGMVLAGVDLSALDPEDTSGWRAAGVTELKARAPSAVVGIVSIPLLALASRRMLGDRGALMLAALLAVSPWHVYWSQAARFYVTQFVLYNLALALYFSATRPISRERLLAALAIAVLAFMSQPTALVLGVVFAADWVFTASARSAGGPVRLGTFGWAAAGGALACCLLLVAADTVTGRNTLAKATSEPIGQSPAGILLASAYLIWPSVAAFAAFSGLCLWRHDRRLAFYLGVAALFPILFYAGLAANYRVGSRYAFIAVFAWLALAAAGLDRAWVLLRVRAGVALAAAPLAALLAGSLMANVLSFRSEGNLHARWGDAAQAVLERRQAGEPVYAGVPYIASYYLGEPARPLPASAEEVAAIPTTAWFIVEENSRRPTRRFWLLPDAELVDYFSLQSAHTTSSIQIYRHTPK